MYYYIFGSNFTVVEEEGEKIMLQDKFDSALFIIKDHNDAIGEKNPGFIDTEKFISNIKACGGTSEERLKSFSYEEILSCLPITEGIKPIILAKHIAKVFRDKEENRPISGKKAEKMSSRELLENFDPSEENLISKKLKEISKGEPFLVYSSGRAVDIEISLALLDEIKQGFGGRRTTITKDGEIKEVLPVGFIPENYADENPLYKNRPLRPDGTCDQTNRSWNGISLEIRQFIRTAIDTGEISEINLDKAHDLMDMAVNPEALFRFKKRYQRTAIEFEKLKSLNKLPILKIILAGKNNVFERGNKVNW